MWKLHAQTIAESGFGEEGWLMLSEDDCKAIAQHIINRTNGELHFIIVMYDKEGNRRQFGYGCEKCASDILFDVAGDLAVKPHNGPTHEVAN